MSCKKPRPPKSNRLGTAAWHLRSACMQLSHLQCPTHNRKSSYSLAPCAPHGDRVNAGGCRPVKMWARGRGEAGGAHTGGRGLGPGQAGAGRRATDRDRRRRGGPARERGARARRGARGVRRGAARARAVNLFSPDRLCGPGLGAGAWKSIGAAGRARRGAACGSRGKRARGGGGAAGGQAYASVWVSCRIESAWGWVGLFSGRRVHAPRAGVGRPRGHGWVWVDQEGRGRAAAHALNAAGGAGCGRSGGVRPRRAPEGRRRPPARRGAWRGPLARA